MKNSQENALFVMGAQIGYLKRTVPAKKDFLIKAKIYTVLRVTLNVSIAMDMTSSVPLV